MGVSQLVDRLLEVKESRHPAADDRPLPQALDASQRRDILLLAACYDQSNRENPELRWGRLRRSLARLGVARRSGTWRWGWSARARSSD